MDSLLLLLLDSRSPAGGHSHSGGLEAAVSAGFVRDLASTEHFCRARLRTAGQVAAAFAATAFGWWGAVPGVPGAPSSAPALEWVRLDAEFSARTPSEHTRTASRQLGSGLRRLLRASLPETDLTTPWALIEKPAPHHPLVLGAGVALAGGTAVIAARAAALSTCTAPATAAVRLLGLDPYAVHGMLARLAAEIDAIAVSSGAYDSPHTSLDQLPATGAPAMELLADIHARSEVRLFAS